MIRVNEALRTSKIDLKISVLMTKVDEIFPPSNYTRLAFPSVSQAMSPSLSSISITNSISLQHQSTTTNDEENNSKTSAPLYQSLTSNTIDSNSFNAINNMTRDSKTVDGVNNTSNNSILHFFEFSILFYFIFDIFFSLFKK